MWLIPDDDRRGSFHRGLFRAVFDDSLAGGSSLVASIDDTVVGVAAWYPPGRDTKPSGDDIEHAIGAMSDADRARLDELRTLTVPHEPAGECYYLWVMAVSPERQRMGIGGALMRAALERCDLTRDAAYLEASTLENRTLYERHGFRELARVDLPDGPPMYPMLRRPAPTTLSSGP